MTAEDIKRRREARGMNDPLNRLSAHIDSAIANGAEPIREMPTPELERERNRKAIFHADKMAESFLSVMLQDMQFSENDEATTEEREPRDVGTIWTVPDSTFRACLMECADFRLAISDHLAAVPDGALAGLDLDGYGIAEQLGSDLYLERAGHGAGFRDRDSWSDDRDECNAIGEALSGLVHSGFESYLGDDGQAYICGRENV